MDDTGWVIHYFFLTLKRLNLAGVSRYYELDNGIKTLADVNRRLIKYINKDTR